MPEHPKPDTLPKSPHANIPARHLLNLTTEEAIQALASALLLQPEVATHCDTVYYQGWTFISRYASRLHHFQLIRQGRTAGRYTATHAELVWVKNRRPFAFCARRLKLYEAR